MTTPFVPKTIDIFNINSYSAQEIILFIAYNMMKQNKIARTAFNRCVFKTKEGSKCAVGFCIPDDKYKSEFENSSEIGCFVDDFGIDITSDRLDILTIFQAIHDQCRNTQIWKCAIIEKFHWYFTNKAELHNAIKAGIAARTAD